MPARKKAPTKRTTRRPAKRASRPAKPKPSLEKIDPARRARIESLRQELFGDFLTAAEVAEILDVHPRTVGEYIRDGKLRAIQLGGGWRVSEEALRTFVKTVAELPKVTTRGSSMFSRFTERARRVVTLADEEARLLKHNYIGTEHLLLGLLSEGGGVGALALTELNVKVDALRKEIEVTIGTGSEAPTGHIPFTPRAKRVLELSLREALLLGHNYIGTEHIVLALLREGEGVAANILTAQGVNEENLKAKVIELLAGYVAAKSRSTRKKKS
jgi:excisionase family DNA binding protein